jgi:osmotically-inducible protein OsmY
MKNIILLLLVWMFLASCVETVVVASVASTIVTTREKSVKDTAKDSVIAAKIDQTLVSNGVITPRNSVKVMVNEGRVLLTGKVTDVQKGKKIYDTAWKTKGVVEVIDEVDIKQEKLSAVDFTSFFSDFYLITKIKAKLFFNKEVTAADFKITSSYGKVYVFGVAKDDYEMEKTLSVISKVVGVKKVINHAILKDDNRRRAS